MKRFINVLLLFAMIFVGISFHNEAVKAAGIYNGYDTYIDWLEAECFKANKSILDLDITYDGGRSTYRADYLETGYNIPEDCVKFIFSMYSHPTIGYKADGTKVIIYGPDGLDGMQRDREGYDRQGYWIDGYDREGYDQGDYDREGYDREGYNREGYNKEGYDRQGIYKYAAVTVDKDSIWFKYSTATDSKKLYWNKKNQFKGVQIYNAKGDWISKDHYKMTTKKVDVNKNGYGKYQVILKFDSTFNNAVVVENVTVIPNSEACMSILTGGYAKTSPRYTGFADSVDFILKDQDPKYYKNIDGVQYSIGTIKSKDVKKVLMNKPVTFQKTYVKNSSANYKIPKGGFWHDKGMRVKRLGNVKDGTTFCIKYRTFVKTKKSKVYSEWKYATSTVKL